jgi:hypothetical protein
MASSGDPIEKLRAVGDKGTNLTDDGLLAIVYQAPERDNFHMDDEPTIVIADDNDAILKAVCNCFVVRTG